MGETNTLYDKIKNTFQHTLIYSIGSVVNSAFGFLLIPLYTRKLKANEYGILALLTVTLTILSTVLKFGLNHAFFRHYYDTEDGEHRHRIVGSTLVFLLGATPLFTVLLYLFAPQISSLVFKGDAGNANLLRYIFLIGFFEVINIVPDSILRAKFYSVRYSILNIITFIIQLSLIIYLVVFVEASVKSVLLGRLVSAAVGSALFFFAARRELSLSFSFTELRGMLAFGTPFIFGAIASTLFIMVDRFFLEHYSTDREVGVYSLANNIVGAVTILVTMPFAQVWTVMRFKVMNEEGAHEYYARVLTYIVLASMFLGLVITALASDAVLLYAHRSYFILPTILPLLALSVVLDSASRVLNVGITLRKRTIYGPLLTLIALAFNIALNFILIPRYGSLGAAVSTFFSYLFFCVIRYVVSNIFFKVKYEWGRVFTMFGIGSLIAAMFYVIDYKRGEAIRTSSLIVAMLLKLTLALMFPLSLFVLKFYDERELSRVVQGWQRIASLIKERKRGEAYLIALFCLGGAAILGIFLLLAQNSRG